jgi:hypothetical protein
MPRARRRFVSDECRRIDRGCPEPQVRPAPPAGPGGCLAHPRLLATLSAALGGAGRRDGPAQPDARRAAQRPDVRLGALWPDCDRGGRAAGACQSAAQPERLAGRKRNPGRFSWKASGQRHTIGAKDLQHLGTGAEPYAAGIQRAALGQPGPSQAVVKQSEAQLAQARTDLLVRVAQAYFDVLAAQDALTALRENKKAVSEQLAQAKREFEVGTKTIVDTHEAKARYDQIDAQEQVARGDSGRQAKRAAHDHRPRRRRAAAAQGPGAT